MKRILVFLVIGLGAVTGATLAAARASACRAGSAAQQGRAGPRRRRG